MQTHFTKNTAGLGALLLAKLIRSTLNKTATFAKARAITTTPAALR